MKKKIRLTFGDRVRQIRQELDFTQSEFASKLGISGPAISEIENDKYKPGHDFFYTLARDFNVNLYYLLFGRGDMFIGLEEGVAAVLKEHARRNPEVEKFLWYFEKSPIVQYYLLGQFRRFMQKEKDDVDRDIEIHKNE
jgi:transcriptional regulator with XRE-family HTH domain